MDNNETRPRKKGALALTVVLLIVAAVGGFLYLQNHRRDQAQEAQVAVTEIGKEASTFFDSLNNAQGIPQPIDKRIDTTPKAKGESGVVERYIKEFMNRVVEQRNQYFAELESVGWSRILDAGRVHADEGLEESRDILRKARTVVGKYEQLNRTLFDTFRSDIDSLQISDEMRRGMVAGFNGNMEKNRATMTKMWSLENQTVDEIEKILNQLESRKGAWNVQNGQFAFQNNADLEAFNDHMAAIKQLLSQQQELQRQSAEDAKRIAEGAK